MIRFSQHPTARARRAAFGEHNYVEQESFITAGEIRTLAGRARIAAGTSLLDVCCGVGGPGRFLMQETGCAYLGVDASARSIALARERAEGLGGRFEVVRVPPLPAGRFDVVVVLETMLAFADKEPLLEAVAAALVPGGRFACTFEEGEPLTPAERAAMPAADTVSPVPLQTLRTMLERHGMTVCWQEDWTRSHRDAAAALLDAYTVAAAEISAEIGAEQLDRLLAAHALWVEWLGTGRVRKLALVAAGPAAADC